MGSCWRRSAFPGRSFRRFRKSAPSRPPPPLCAQQTGILTGAIRGVDVHPLDARISQLRAALPEVNKLCWLDEPALAVAEMWRRLFTPIEVDHETP
jgi:hypothetical protein